MKEPEGYVLVARECSVARAKDMGLTTLVDKHLVGEL